MSLGFPSELTDTERGLITVGGVRTSDIKPCLSRSQTAEGTKSPCSRADLLLDKQTPRGITYPDLIVLMTQGGAPISTQNSKCALSRPLTTPAAAACSYSYKFCSYNARELSVNLSSISVMNSCDTSG